MLIVLVPKRENKNKNQERGRCRQLPRVEMERNVIDTDGECKWERGCGCGRAEGYCWYGSSAPNSTPGCGWESECGYSCNGWYANGST